MFRNTKIKITMVKLITSYTNLATLKLVNRDRGEGGAGRAIALPLLLLGFIS